MLAYRSMAETQHAAGLAVPFQRSAALFAARLRTARSETPGWRILCSSPAAFARRLDLIADEKGNSAVRLEAGLDFGATFTRGCTAGLLSTVLQRTRHCSLTMLFAGVNLDSLAACCVSTRMTERAVARFASLLSPRARLHCALAPIEGPKWICSDYSRTHAVNHSRHSNRLALLHKDYDCRFAGTIVTRAHSYPDDCGVRHQFLGVLLL